MSGDGGRTVGAWTSFPAHRLPVARVVLAGTLRPRVPRTALTRSGGSLAPRAKAMCGGCPVREQCLDLIMQREAVDTKAVRAGVWAEMCPRTSVTPCPGLSTSQQSPATPSRRRSGRLRGAVSPGRRPSPRRPALDHAPRSGSPSPRRRRDRLVTRIVRIHAPREGGPPRMSASRSCSTSTEWVAVPNGSPAQPQSPRRPRG